VDEVKPYNTRYDQTQDDIDNKRVTISFYENPKAFYKSGEQGVHFIEATGPWHRITWLETSVMQCVYEAKLRYDLQKKRKTYSEWLYGSLLRCAKSIVYTRLVQKNVSDIKPALFTGRRTGGLLFLVLQNLLFADHFKQMGPLFNGAVEGLSYTDPEATESLGTSSCDSWYILKNLGLPCLNPSGTHAHELSMVTSVLYPQLDQNDQHLPLTQIIGHYLYSELTQKKTTGPMPMLPDTLGTRAFMKAATYVTLPDGQSFLSLINSARQDSGKLKDFKTNMATFGYSGSMMASEIDDTSTLLEAAEMGYATFGAGGFFGDSEKVWGDKKASSNSMAVKAVRVMYKSEPINGIPYIQNLGNNMVVGYPIKIGDPADAFDPKLAEGKLSLDKNLDPSLLEPIKRYAETVRVEATTTPLVGTKPLSEIFTFNQLGGKNLVFNRMRHHTRKSRRGGKLTHEQRYLSPGYNEIIDIESNPGHPLNQVIFDYIIKQRPSRPDLASNPNLYLQSIYGDEKTKFQAFLQSLDAPPAIAYNSIRAKNDALKGHRQAMVNAYLKTNPQPKQVQTPKPVTYEQYGNNNLEFPTQKPINRVPNSKNKTKRTWLQYLGQRPGKVARSLVRSTRNNLRNPVSYF